jgi:hypothetical protein
MAPATQLPSLEQLARDLLSQAVANGLVMPSRPAWDPQCYHVTELAGLTAKLRAAIQAHVAVAMAEVVGHECVPVAMAEVFGPPKPPRR